MTLLNRLRRAFTLFLGFLPAVLLGSFAVPWLLIASILSLNGIGFCWGICAALGPAGLLLTVLDLHRGLSVWFLLAGMLAISPLLLDSELMFHWMLFPFWVALFNLIWFAFAAALSASPNHHPLRRTP